MKQSEISKIPKLIEKVEDSEFKFNRIQSLIKQICSPNSPGWDQASGTLKQALTQKKITANTILESGQSVQKTVKIKKNKRKKKKKNLLVTSQLQKNITHQLCGCCSGKLDNTQTQDGYQSDQEDYNSQSHIQSIIKTIGQQLLECFYDEIDKSIVRIMKDAESQQSKTFMKLMKKLAQIFEDYDQQFREQIQRQLQDQAFTPLEIGWNSCDQFKAYIVTRFPLLKDFIENFKMTELDQKQSQELFKLQCRNPLIHSIYSYIQQIAAKKSRKKNKRKLQKLGKQSLQSNDNQLKIQFSIQTLCSNSFNDIIQKLKNMKIKDKQREGCYFNEQKFSSFKQQLKFKKKGQNQS